MKRANQLKTLVVLAISASAFLAVQGAVAKEDPPTATKDPTNSEPADPTPYYRVVYQKAGIGCDVGTPIVEMEDLCSQESTVSEWAEPGTKIAVVEAQWDALTPLAAKLAVDHFTYVAPNVVQAWPPVRTEGTSILRLELPAKDGALLEPAPALVHFSAPNAPSLVVQQDIEVAFSIFVGMDPPAGYSAYGPRIV